MYKVVTDSNVLISALHFGGKPEELLLSANEGAIELFVSPFILEETARVLQAKLGWGKREIEEAFAMLKEIATVVEPEIKVDVVSGDETDNRILECALQARADFLVTGDKRHLLPLKRYKRIQILAPADFLEILAKRKYQRS